MRGSRETPSEGEDGEEVRERVNERRRTGRHIKVPERSIPYPDHNHSF